MPGKIIPLAAIGILLVLAPLAASQIIHVDADGLNDPGSGTYEDPFRRIQDAVDAAVHGDRIEIKPGVYCGIGNYDIDPGGKSITIAGTDPNTAASTVIDAKGEGRGFIFQNGEDSNCILSGLTIRNGYARDDSGGGISCYYSSPVIINCIIENNVADNYGGGIYIFDSSPRFIQCIIRNNQAVDGGGMECSGGAPMLDKCVITNNHAEGLGGGCDFFFEAEPSLINCVIVKNSSTDGGGICCMDSRVTVSNSILWQNQAVRGSQMALEFLILNSAAFVNYSDFQGGQLQVHDPNSDMIWASGNIIADPYFVSFDPNGDPEIWDFHLQSAYGRWDQNSRTWVRDSSTSPCIDAGNPDTDWSSEPWPNGKRVNMGAFGGTSLAGKNGNRSDFNIDDIVNLLDFCMMAEQWMAGHTCNEDLNLDQDVDSEDFVLFAEDWLWEKPNPADFNGDNKVNLEDFSRLAERWLMNQSCIEDLNRDGNVDIIDLSLFAEQWLWGRP